jgi:CRISPR-associated protein Cas5h
MDVLSFRWRAKYGHFLRAEANVNALTYPVPPRTAVLGLLAAIMGLEKDRIAAELQDAQVAVAGSARRRFWHRVKLRKDPPRPLPLHVILSQKISEETIPEKAALNRQEWLLDPDFQVHVALPEQPERFAELVNRIQEQRWYFSPCMGLSEMLAELEFIACQSAEKLASGHHRIDGFCPAADVRLLAEEGLGVHLLRMPHSVSENRVFHHTSYYVEHKSRPFLVETAAAWQVGEATVVFS